MTTRPEIDALTIALHSQQDRATGQTWVHLLPAGTFTGRDGRGPYHAADAAAIMSVSRQLAGRTRMPVDYNHAIDLAAPKGEASPAAGWITGLQSRQDGIWGLVEWTPKAAQHIADREYRYLSPAFAHTREGAVTAILRASLVNYPNLTQLVALASAEIDMADTEDTNPTLDAIRALLGLEAGADAAAITGAIGALKVGVSTHAAAPDPSKFVPIGDYLRVTQELRKVHAGVELQAAKDYVEEQVRKATLLPFQREWAVGLASVNMPALQQFIATSGGITARLIQTGPAAAAFRDHGGARPDLDDADEHVAKLLGHSPEAFEKAKS